MKTLQKLSKRIKTLTFTIAATLIIAYLAAYYGIQLTAALAQAPTMSEKLHITNTFFLTLSTQTIWFVTATITVYLIFSSFTTFIRFNNSPQLTGTLPVTSERFKSNTNGWVAARPYIIALWNEYLGNWDKWYELELEDGTSEHRARTWANRNLHKYDSRPMYRFITQYLLAPTRKREEFTVPHDDFINQHSPISSGVITPVIGPEFNSVRLWGSNDLAEALSFFEIDYTTTLEHDRQLRKATRQHPLYMRTLGRLIQWAVKNTQEARDIHDNLMHFPEERMVFTIHPKNDWERITAYALASVRYMEHAGSPKRADIVEMIEEYSAGVNFVQDGRSMDAEDILRWARTSMYGHNDAERTDRSGGSRLVFNAAFLGTSIVPASTLVAGCKHD